MRRLMLLPALTTLLCAQSPLPYKGFNPAWMDRSAKPCTDFYQYALGGWMKTAEIPKEYPFNSVDIDVNERIQAQVRTILDEASKEAMAPGAKASSPKGRVGAFYAAAMDEAAVEKAGAKPLQPLLAKVDALKEAAGLPALLAELARQGVGSGFGFYVAQDERFSTEVVPQLGQGGLGLPERDYYLKADEESQVLRTKYEAHIVEMLLLVGVQPAEAKAQATAILALETKLAQASKGIVELRDPVANYHRMTLPELEKAAPGLPWSAFFAGVGLAQPGPIVVHQPEFMQAFDRLAHDVSLADWKAYLRWHVVRGSASQLSKPFVEASFGFYGKTLSGTEALRPRWKRMFGQVDAFLGEDMGQLYVAKHFPPAAKAKVYEMVMNLKAVLRSRIVALPWMGEATKKEALRKLEAFQVKVGYPDKFRDYSTLEVRRDDFFGNVLRASEWEFRRNIAKVGKPVDRGEWGMTPQTNNAYYNPSLNEICFPAGILQFPYFDLSQDDAVNYGNIGATIGHEMTHGFDDQGRQYDAEGNLRDWWTKADADAYNGRAELVAKQFDAFEPLPGVHINGKQTLGENIADLGGLLLAWDAWRMTLKGKPEPASIEGFTPKQRFFLGYAETWRMKARPEYLKLLVATDVHAPAQFRVTGPLANLPEFYEAFGCQDGEPMKRDAKVRPSIW